MEFTSSLREGGVIVVIGSFATVLAASIAARWVASRSSTSSSLKGTTAYLLVDNGSLRAASVLSLRRLAAHVSSSTGVDVISVGARISDRAPVAELGGVPAEVLTKALARLANEGVDKFVFLPAFLGPSETMSHYAPSVVEEVSRKVGRKLTFAAAKAVVDVDSSSGRADDRIAHALVENVISTAAARGWSDSEYSVAVCDHGSPTKAVTDVRDHVAKQVEQILRDKRVKEGRVPPRVSACSMERRPEAEYDFTEPALERLLRPTGRGGGYGVGFDSGKVIVALMFIAPGRHAGEGGDIATILAQAEKEAQESDSEGKAVLETAMTGLLGESDKFKEVVVERFREVLAIASSSSSSRSA